MKTMYGQKRKKRPHQKATPFRQGDRAVYYGSTVTVLQTNRDTALVKREKETFCVDYALLTRPVKENNP